MRQDASRPARWVPPTGTNWRAYASFMHCAVPVTDSSGALSPVTPLPIDGHAAPPPAFWEAREGLGDGPSWANCTDRVPGVHFWHPVPSGVCAVVLQHWREFRQDSDARVRSRSRAANRLEAAGVAAGERAHEEGTVNGGNGDEAALGRSLPASSSDGNPDDAVRSSPPRDASPAGSSNRSRRSHKRKRKEKAAAAACGAPAEEEPERVASRRAEQEATYIPTLPCVWDLVEPLGLGDADDEACDSRAPADRDALYASESACVPNDSRYVGYMVSRSFVGRGDDDNCEGASERETSFFRSTPIDPSLIALRSDDVADLPMAPWRDSRATALSANLRATFQHAANSKGAVRVAFRALESEAAAAPAVASTALALVSSEQRDGEFDDGGYDDDAPRQLLTLRSESTPAAGWLMAAGEEGDGDGDGDEAGSARGVRVGAGLGGCAGVSRDGRAYGGEYAEEEGGSEEGSARAGERSPIAYCVRPPVGTRAGDLFAAKVADQRLWLRAPDEWAEGEPLCVYVSPVAAAAAPPMLRAQRLQRSAGDLPRDARGTRAAGDAMGDEGENARVCEWGGGARLRGGAIGGGGLGRESDRIGDNRATGPEGAGGLASVRGERAEGDGGAGGVGGFADPDGPSGLGADDVQTPHGGEQRGLAESEWAVTVPEGCAAGDVVIVQGGVADGGRMEAGVSEGANVGLGESGGHGGHNGHRACSGSDGAWSSAFVLPAWASAGSQVTFSLHALRPPQFRPRSAFAPLFHVSSEARQLIDSGGFSVGELSDDDSEDSEREGDGTAGNIDGRVHGGGGALGAAAGDAAAECAAGSATRQQPEQGPRDEERQVSGQNSGYALSTESVGGAILLPNVQVAQLAKHASQRRFCVKAPANFGVDMPLLPVLLGDRLCAVIASVEATDCGGTLLCAQTWRGNLPREDETATPLEDGEFWAEVPRDAAEGDRLFASTPQGRIVSFAVPPEISSSRRIRVRIAAPEGSAALRYTMHAKPVRP